MSIQLIQQYYSNVERLIRYGGTRNESSLRKAFQELLDHYARSKNLLLVPEVGGLAEALRAVISEQVGGNSSFRQALEEFLELAKKAINPKIEMADVRE